MIDQKRIEDYKRIIDSAVRTSQAMANLSAGAAAWAAKASKCANDAVELSKKAAATDFSEVTDEELNKNAEAIVDTINSSVGWSFKASKWSDKVVNFSVFALETADVKEAEK